jgi:hypothetical protein
LRAAGATNGVHAGAVVDHVIDDPVREIVCRVRQHALIATCNVRFDGQGSLAHVRASHLAVGC